MPLADPDVQPQLLTVACRFVPYDQWLTTHVDPTWKVKQIKLWILSKCLGIPLDSASHPGGSNYPQTSTSAQATTAPGQRYRPASPITFAPDPRRRPVSPILFAKGTKGKEDKEKKGKTKGREPAAPSNTGDAPSADEKPTPSPVDGVEEDDDKGDSFDEAEVYRASPPPPLPPPLPPPAPSLPLQPTSAKWAKYNTVTSTYTLLRFSTGQILEDDLALTWYDVSQHELLELHAHSDVCSAPDASGVMSSSSSPLTTVSEHVHGGSNLRHNRSASLYSLALPSSALSAAAQAAFNTPQRVYLPPLNRAVLPQYVLPYWEGRVHALRVVWRVPDLDVPVANFANGYGIGYGGLGTTSMGGHEIGSYSGMRGAGGWDASVGRHTLAGQDAGAVPRHKKTSLEWRTRWLVIREGVLSLCRDRDDPTPTHILPLSSLTALRGAEHLAKSTYFSQAHPHHDKKSHSKSPSKSKKKKGRDIDTPRPRHPPQARQSTSTSGGTYQPVTDSEESDTAPAYPRRSTDSGVGVGEDGKAHSNGGQPIDDLRIVCIKFKMAERLKRDPRLDDTAVKVYGYAPGYGEDKDKDREKERREKEGWGVGRGAYTTTTTITAGGGGKGKGKDKKDKEEKRKKKGLLPWERDDKGKGKEKRDWISSALGVKKEKEKEKDRRLGKGLGLGLGLTAGVQDAKERFMREREQEREREREQEREREREVERKREQAALLEADAEARITFARRPAEGGASSSDGGITEEEGDHEEDAREGDGDQQNKRHVKGKGSRKDKGKGKELPVDSRDDAGLRRPFNRDVDADSDTDHESPIPPNARPDEGTSTTQLAGTLSDADDVSDAWSSPVFAHTDGSSDGGGSDGESEVGGPPGRSADGYRYGYRFGHRHESAEAARLGAGTSESGLRAEQESVLEEEDRREKEKANLERRKQKERTRTREEDREKEKEREKAEWIVLDMGNDIAFSSFLRILHRHLSPHTPSSFVSSNLSSSPIATPTPTPTRTPFPSPSSPRAQGSTPQPFPTPSLADLWRDEDKASSQTQSSAPPTSHEPASGSPTSSFRSGDRMNYEPPGHPPALADLSHPPTDAPSSLGVLPYPEWRTELAERAQRAGMGDIGRAMKWVLFQSARQLELDLEEVRARHNDDQRATAEVRRKKRAASSIQNNRRRSTSSRTSTITGGSNASKAASSTVYDSDVSEETGGMIEMSDSEECSEAEWQGWTADLHRQHRAQAQRKGEEEERKATVAADREKAFDESDGEMLEPPKTVEEDRTQVLERRMMLEPSAVVTTMYSAASAARTSFSTPSGTLYSPSSSESLSHRHRAMSFSPVDRSSSPAATSLHSHHGHTYSQSISPLGSQVARKHVLPAGNSLSHSASMYATGLRSGAATPALNLRRPSMPIITADQTFSLLEGAVIAPHAAVLRSPTASNFSFPAPAASYRFPDDQTSHTPSSTFTPVSSSPTSMPRRASSAGLVSLAGSFGRSSSVLARSGVVKKDGTKEAERMREKELKRAREQEDKAKEKERKLQRPKLSLATSSTHSHAAPPSETRQVRSPTISETGRAIMRRVKSGSSLNAGIALEEAHSPSLTQECSAAPHAAKKKRTVLVNRIVRGLDSAMDFVDGK
ncbi:hypothetical protein DXG03_006923 [Asterophora parasitica]|uniref:Uncharacterized protein n=1 Tax=Asterophora parasitica TaxID=117018 RepID=A0A9P7G8Z2_9AGAR|nr:hypothetical protein DXG03_006923 [Asterophora parasitica]